MSAERTGPGLADRDAPCLGRLTAVWRLVSSARVRARRPSRLCPVPSPRLRPSRLVVTRRRLRGRHRVRLQAGEARGQVALPSSEAPTFCLETVPLPRTSHPRLLGRTWVPRPPLIEKMGVLEGCVFTPSQTRSFLERKAMGAVKAATRNCHPVCPLLSGTHSHPPRHTHGARPVSRGRRPVCRRAPPRPGGSVRPRATLRPVSPQTSAPRDSASATG